ncbi:probable RNA-binding protein EIF1AD [Exaiptasia diaphana]|uniref:Probable RNA-binding protein EIF1AD n=1 Tax=Exaiptasia diaphana TaxID=2652724 RepID=A0A913X025_EXADI|nr:probable RNA-binding protein EIF1AD [Exaiptasia diaphana]KXJ30036.1 putative RNA-binding protein EIF1AD [Exaiptasia diaphana]
MSKATKRKHVTKEVLDDYVVPDENQEIVKVLAGRGNNLHEVENAEGKHFLVSMPSKFRRNVWIKRGDFVIVEPIEEGNKVCAEIVHILYSKQVKYLKEEKLWPEAFTEKSAIRHEEIDDKKSNSSPKLQNELPSDSESDEDCDDDLFVNTNRPPPMQFSDESDSEDEDNNDNKNDEQDI